MLKKALGLGLTLACLSETAAFAQTIEQRANEICAATVAAYRDQNKNSSGPVQSQVLANNLLTRAADSLESVGVSNMLVSELRQRVAIGEKYAVTMDRGNVKETMALSARLDENGARIVKAATTLSLGQCFKLGGL